MRDIRTERVGLGCIWKDEEESATEFEEGKDPEEVPVPLPPLPCRLSCSAGLRCTAGFRLINSRRSGLPAWKSGCLKTQPLIRINISKEFEEWWMDIRYKVNLLTNLTVIHVFNFVEVIFIQLSDKTCEVRMFENPW